MIDINKLRRLAQAATPHVGHACKYQDAHWLREGHVDFENADLFIASERPQEDAAFYAAANPAAISELLDRLEAAEKERDALRAALQHEADCVEAAKAEIKALHAKITEMERQEPARLVTPTAYRWRYRGAVKWQYGELTEETVQVAKEHNHEIQSLGLMPEDKLYALPGAQPAPSIKDAIIEDLQSQFDSEGITEHDSGDALIRLSDAIAAVEDNFVQPTPNVPDGWQLVPIEPTEDMLRAMTDPFIAINGDNRKAFEIAYTAMLAAAPEAKP